MKNLFIIVFETLPKLVLFKLEKDKNDLRLRLDNDNSLVHFQLEETTKNLQTEIDENYSTNTTRINDLADNLANIFKTAIAKLADENTDRIHEIEG